MGSGLINQDAATKYHNMNRKATLTIYFNHKQSHDQIPNHFVAKIVPIQCKRVQFYADFKLTSEYDSIPITWLPFHARVSLLLNNYKLIILERERERERLPFVFLWLLCAFWHFQSRVIKPITFTTICLLHCICLQRKYSTREAEQ
jgi:hypothetical protein